MILPSYPPVRGEHVLLRSITWEDTPLIVRWRANPRVRANFIYREPLTREIHERWLMERVATGEVVQFIICAMAHESADEVEPVGSVYLRDIDREGSLAEYGIFMGEDGAAGRGLGTETARLMVQWASEVLGLRTLILRVYVDNIAAIKSYEAAGFTRDRLMPAVRSSDGEERDMLLMLWRKR